MLHRVADVQHFSCLGIHRALGSVLPRESWGRGGDGDGRGGKAAGMRQRRSGPGGQRQGCCTGHRVPPSVGFFAFFISLSSVNSLHPTTKRGPPLSVPHDYSLKRRAGPSLPSDGLGDTNHSHRRESGGPAPSSAPTRLRSRKLLAAARGWKPIWPPEVAALAST